MGLGNDDIGAGQGDLPRIDAGVPDVGPQGDDPSRPDLDGDERMERLRHDLAVANDIRFTDDVPGLDDV